MNKQPVAPASVAVKSAFDYYDAEIPFKDNSPVSIARVLAKSDFLKGNSIGDRVSLDPQKAQWLEKRSVVVVEVVKVLPSDIRAAGGFDAFLAANRKLDRLTSADRSKLKKIPGVPTAEDKKQPWEFEEV